MCVTVRLIVLHQIVFLFVGFKFFVMEKMDSGLSSVVTHVLQIKPSSKEISFGPVAVRLLTCVQAIHDRGNIIRDVKTENFMLARGNGQGSSPEQKIASRIRLLDLALAAQWTSTYRETIEGENLVGTPLYASLNVHVGKKPSFRDDLEALGYVIAELLTQLYAGDSSMQLPWVSGKSDDEIASMKKAQVNNPESDFYRQLGNAETITVFSEYLNAVRQYTFKQKPDYAELAKVLSKLSVPRNTKARPAARTKKDTQRVVAAKSSAPADTALRVGTKRTKRDRDDVSETSNGSLRRASRRQKSSGMTIDEDICMESGAEQGTVRSDERQDMDWEYTVDENEKPPEESAPVAKLSPLRRSERVIVNERPSRKRQNTRQEVKSDIIVICDDEDEEQKPQVLPKEIQRRGLRIEVIEGPHTGEFFELKDGSSDTLILGSNPSSRVGTIVALKKDKSLDGTHVRLDLNVKKGGLTALTVTDKSKKGKTFVNRDAVKSTKAFVNDTIRIGNTALKITSL